MKMFIALPLLVLLSACSTNPQKLAAHDENYKLCGNHMADYQFFKTELQKEREAVCANGCVYTPSMNKNSDTMERIAGMYYLMNCDYSHGRL